MWVVVLLLLLLLAVAVQRRGDTLNVCRTLAVKDKRLECSDSPLVTP